MHLKPTKDFKGVSKVDANGLDDREDAHPSVWSLLIRPGDTHSHIHKAHDCTRSNGCHRKGDTGTVSPMPSLLSGLPAKWLGTEWSEGQGCVPHQTSMHWPWNDDVHGNQLCSECCLKHHTHTQGHSIIHFVSINNRWTAFPRDAWRTFNERAVRGGLSSAQLSCAC